jgi:hypothetical protein
MADVTGAFLRGHAAGQAEQEHQQTLEDNKLRTLVLKHEIDRMKIDDQVRTREFAKQNLDFLHGQPAADIPSDPVTSQQPNLPSTSLAGVVAGLQAGAASNVTGAPAAENPGTIPAPAAQDPMTEAHPVTRNVARAIAIPGVPGLNVPGVSVRPRSMEDLIQAQIASKMAEPYTLAPGAKRMIGTETIGGGGPEFHSVGAGGLAVTQPTGETKLVVPGRAAPNRARTVSGMINGRRAFAVFNPDTEKYTVGGKDVTALFTPAPSAAESSDADEQRKFSRDFRQYTSEIAVAQRKHAEQFKNWQIGANSAFKGVDVRTGKPLGDAPEYTPPTFDEWRESHAAPGGPGGAPKTVTQPTDPLQVADPADGRIYTFPTAEKAAGYRKAKGIQ